MATLKQIFLEKGLREAGVLESQPQRVSVRADSGGTQVPCSHQQGTSLRSHHRASGHRWIHQRLRAHLTLSSFPLLEEELYNPYVLEWSLGL